MTELTATTDPVSTDVLPIVDVASDETKKVTIADLLENAGAGSASAAAFAFDGDSDTGMYRYGVNALAFTTGGTGRLFVNSGGSVGVGTDSPTTKVDSIGTIQARLSDSTKGVQISDDGAVELYRSDSSGFIDFKTSLAEDFDCRVQQADNGLGINTGGQGNSLPRRRFCIASDGKVGLGTTTPQAILHTTQTSAGSSVVGAAVRNNSANANTGVSFDLSPSSEALGYEVPKSKR